MTQEDNEFNYDVKEFAVVKANQLAERKNGYRRTPSPPKIGGNSLKLKSRITERQGGEISTRCITTRVGL